MKRLFPIAILFISLASQGQQLIPLGPDNIINLTTKPGDLNYTTTLLDEQGADPVNGIMTPVPHTAFESGYSTQPGYPAVNIIDLKNLYNLSEIALYSKYGVDEINFEFSMDDSSFRNKVTYHPSGSGFFYLKVNELARYIKIYYSNKGYQKVMELYLYGAKAPKNSGKDSGAKVLKTYTIELMSDSTFRVKN